jgi:hypothetical protein
MSGLRGGLQLQWLKSLKYANATESLGIVPSFCALTSHQWEI